jgi:hypothetical protein
VNDGLQRIAALQARREMRQAASDALAKRVLKFKTANPERNKTEIGQACGCSLSTVTKILSRELQ